MAATALAAAGLATGVAGAALEGGGGSSRLNLPPELMTQMIGQLQSNLNMTNQDIQRIQTMTNFYDQQMATIQKSIEGVIPEQEAITGLQKQQAQLGQALGMSAQELIDSGFLTESAQSQLQSLEQERQALAAKIGTESQDPALIQKQQAKRAQLEQDLRRQNVTGSQLSRYLAEFDQNARVERYGQAQNEFAQGLQVLQAGYQQFGLGQDASAQGFQQALGAFGAGQSALEQLGGQFSAGQSALLGIAGGRFQAGMSGIAAKQELGAGMMDQFAQAGQYKYSGTIKDALQSGLIGGGSLGSQTGLSKDEIKKYASLLRKEPSGGTGVERVQPIGGVTKGSINQSQLEDLRRKVDAARLQKTSLTEEV